MAVVAASSPIWNAPSTIPSPFTVRVDVIVVVPIPTEEDVLTPDG